MMRARYFVERFIRLRLQGLSVSELEEVVQYLKDGHDSLMLAVGGMLAEAARQRFVHVKLGTHEVGSAHADGGTATAAAGQRVPLLLMLAVAHHAGPWQGGRIRTRGMRLLKR